MAARHRVFVTAGGFRESATLLNGGTVKIPAPPLNPDGKEAHATKRLGEPGKPGKPAAAQAGSNNAMLAVKP
jgi:hypothetical protein